MEVVSLGVSEAEKSVNHLSSEMGREVVKLHLNSTSSSHKY